MNVLLADTDQDILKNIRNHLRGAHPELKIVGIANDKNAVVPNAAELDAALLIADVRFLGATVYAILRDLHERRPEMFVVLYGAFNEGEIMVKAMEFGVVDYMYKPLRPSELSRCMQTVLRKARDVEDSRREEEDFSKHYDEKVYLFKEMFLSNLLCGSIGNDAEIHRSFDYFKMQFTKGFTVFVIRIDQFKKVMLTLDEKEKHLLSFKICFFATEAMKGKQCETAIVRFNQVAVLVGGFEELDKMIELCEKMKEEIYSRMQIRVTIGIGRTYENPSDISVSCREAESALRYRFHVGYNTVVPIHYVEPTNVITYRYPFDLEDRLVFTAVIGEYKYCRILLEEIFNSLSGVGPLPDKFLSKLVMNIIISINRNLSEQNIPLQSPFTTFFPSKEVLEIDDIDSAFEYLDKALKSFCAFIVEYHESLNAKLVADAKKICDEKYYESFSINKIAGTLGTTPEYLNRLFLDREKKPLLDYAVRVRLNEAKKLMRETEMSDDMVAVKVGYDDGRHFRSVFRKYEGVNTTDYRAQYNALSTRMISARRGL